MPKCVIAEYHSITSAKTGLEVLKTDGFTHKHVSVVSHAKDPSAKYLQDLPSESTDEEHRSGTGNTQRVGLGALIGGTVTAPFAIGSMIGPFFIAGPIVGMAVGAAIGGLLTGTEEWGVQRDVAADYEQRVASGSVLIIVTDEDSMRINDARALLKTTDPKSLEVFE